METQTRLRPPNLQLAWVDRGSVQHHPRSASFSSRSSVYSPTMRSPNMPSPMYPRSPPYDYSMRRRERAMVDSFDPRGRPGSLETQEAWNLSRSLPPIEERQSWDRRRSSFDSVASPRAPAPTPVSPLPPMQHQRPQTLVSQTRSMLLAGVPAASSEPPQSLPPSLPGKRRDSHQERQELQAWGHVFFGTGSEANCFVSAVALRRSSESSSSEDGSTSAVKDAKPGNRVTIRARVRPCALGRRPFLLKREFDMDELRSTIPESSPIPASPPRRLSVDTTGRGGHALQQHQTRRRSSAGHGSDALASPVRSSSTVPIHSRYARAFFPVLAALIYSGHIHQRDIIDLPLPRPEVWTQTVAYVYTGQGELTDAMKQNIVYLGGKV